MPISDDLLNPRRKNPLTLPLLVIALLALAGGAFVLGRFSAGPADPAAVAEGAGGGAGGGAAGAPGVAAVVEPPPPLVPTEVAMGDVLPGTDGLRRISVEIHGSLTQSINQVIGADVGDPLALVSSRLLVWWLSPSRDLRPGDQLEVLYSLPAGEEPMVHALRFKAGKLGNVEKRAYRFQPEGSPFARYFDEAGREIEERLENGPIDEYEQITSLLKDGRGHKGVDFKAPVGTAVKMPWDGTVVRKNWNYRYNGGSLEVRDGKGRSVIFLHLDSVEKSLKAGSRVRKGQVVAKAGNTGRSTAPHLHYQVMAGKKVLDPFDLHDTYRVSLPAGAKAAFDATVAELDDVLAGRPLVATTPAPTPAAGNVIPARAQQ
ncbi:M23 family metallopeptidase [Vulgatibacter sp.]|uniref:M23 family metallopeptidase n=1 Tax=Vulgatibacter sp. TaxID=1971226 RepID=UPI0035650BD0